ncbi:MAG TPA: acetyl-CoA carboxylase biotin carboxyl carrier protein [Candidatus Acidoferrum sp.]|nr:acetyl-CoA carboxylase biotin carboxyl carrier protein [Candidatus Acidoferrum sp.]
MAKKSNPEASQAGSPRGVDFVEVERLLAFMEKHGLEEFEYERDGVRVRLKKPSVQLVTSSHVQHAPLHGAGTHSAPSSHAPAPSEAASTQKGEELHVIKSPIVGTFYSAASPGADPFVTIGARVDSGQVLCIIEAMKLMNEIESDVSGEVVKIFAENGQPVEYGEPLFGIRPHGKK